MGMDFMICLRLIDRVVADLNIGLNVLAQHFFPLFQITNVTLAVELRVGV